MEKGKEREGEKQKLEALERWAFVSVLLKRSMGESNESVPARLLLSVDDSHMCAGSTCESFIIITSSTTTTQQQQHV